MAELLWPLLAIAQYVVQLCRQLSDLLRRVSLYFVPCLAVVQGWLSFFKDSMLRHTFRLKGGCGKYNGQFCKKCFRSH